MILIYLLLRRHWEKKSSVVSEVQNIQEKVNITKNQIQKHKSFLSALNSKIERYNNLKILIEKISRQLELEAVTKSLLESIFSLICQNKGNCMLYLVDALNQQINLYAEKKENPRIIIKATQGDIFDFWVLKHTSSLLVTDVKKDFRFDLEYVDHEHTRKIRSIISAPLISQDRVLGIIRLDTHQALAYTQDDLRFLNTIADFATIAIENAQLFKTTKDLAIKDSLTSCFTKGYFLERIREEIKKSARKQKDLALLMIDIDYFKKYNDKFGHVAGDILLKDIGALVRVFSDQYGGTVSRFGGEEFSILLPNISKQEAKEIAEELRLKVQNKSIILRQKETSITVSIGVASYPEDASEEEGLINSSDIAMYRAKQKGRNRVCGS